MSSIAYELPSSTVIIIHQAKARCEIQRVLFFFHREPAYSAIGAVYFLLSLAWISLELQS